MSPTVKQEPVDLPVEEGIEQENMETEDYMPQGTSSSTSGAKEEHYDGTRFVLRHPELWNDHISISDGKKTCLICSQTFAQLHGLKSHIQSIHSLVEFACPICPKKFKRKYKLTAHTKFCHDSSIQNVCSDISNQQLQQETAVAIKYLCETCDRRFRNPQNLHLHIIHMHDEITNSLEGPKIKHEFLDQGLLHQFDPVTQMKTPDISNTVTDVATPILVQISYAEKVRSEPHNPDNTSLDKQQVKVIPKTCAKNGNSEHLPYSLGYPNSALACIFHRAYIRGNSVNSSNDVKLELLKKYQELQTMTPMKRVINQEPVSLPEVITDVQDPALDGGNTSQESVTTSKTNSNYHTKSGHCEDITSNRDDKTCFICSKTFTQSYNLKRHIRNIHRFACSICHMAFKKNNMLDEHIKTHHDLSQHGIPIPVIHGIPTPSSIPETVSEKEQEGKLTSKSSIGTEQVEDSLNSKPENQNSSNENLNSQSPDCIADPNKPYIQCDKCRKIFLNEGALRNHICAQVWKCEVCEYQFEKRRALLNHMSKVHKDWKREICDKCNKPIRNMKAHIKRMHVQENKHKCGFCTRSFYDRCKLVIHERNHTGERPYPCQVCDKKFICESQLRQHLASHETGKHFMCEICGKVFKSHSVLCNHKIKHNPKTISCEICGKLFNLKEKLKLHLTVHTGEQPHSCKYCGKKFARYSNMVLHVRIHTNERPYCCGICGKTFYNASNHKTHIRSHLRQ